MSMLLETFKGAWTAQIELAVFFIILVTIVWNLVALLGGLRALKDAENPINAHLIAPVYERYANFPKALRALALISLLVGLLGWAAVGYQALTEAASLPGPIVAKGICDSLAEASVILAIGAFNATLGYVSYCVFAGLLALRYSRSIHRLASRRAP